MIELMTHHDDSAVAGARSMLPLAIGAAPFGIAIGATIATSPVEWTPALASSLLLFAGSAQLAMIQLLAAGSAGAVAVGVALMINLRFVAYSSALAPLFPLSGRRARALMATTLVDQTYLVTSVEASAERRDEPSLRRFYLGASLTIGVFWCAAQVVGLAMGTALPESANLGAAAPISLCGLAANAIAPGASTVALCAAVAAQLALAPVAGHLSLVLAILCGVALATAWEGGSEREGDR